MKNKMNTKYSEEFKEMLREEYIRNLFGYKRLAKKYGLKRDAVRGIILKR